ncbi:MAG: hypothetical protein AB8H03_05905 [Saprospiraceae bacterium]
MAEIIIDENNNNLRITFKQKPTSIGIQLTLMVFGLSCFVFGIYLVFRFQFSSISLGGFFILSLVAYFLIKRFIWNRLGKEIVEISENRITQIYDYVYFREAKGFKNSKIDLMGFPQKGEKTNISFEKILDSNLILDQGVKIVLKGERPNFLVINTIIPSKEEAIKIMGLINNKLKTQ